jgi:hypothetical protein
LIALVITFNVYLFKSIEEPQGAWGVYYFLVLSVVICLIAYWLIEVSNNVLLDILVLSLMVSLVCYVFKEPTLRNFLRESGLLYTSRYVAENRETIINNLMFQPSTFKNAVSDSMRGDREIAREAVKRAAPNYEFVSEKIRSDPQFVVEMFEDKRFGKGKYKVLPMLSHDVLTDSRLQQGLASIEYWEHDNGPDVAEIQYEFIPADKFLDREFVLQLVKANPYIYRYLDKSFQSDQDIFEQGLAVWDSFQYVPEEVRSDRAMVLKAMSINSDYLSNVGESFQSDKEIVLAGVRSHGGCLYWASAELQGDREIVEEAIRTDPTALGVASKELQNDKEIVLSAVRVSSKALEHASEELRGDRSILLEAIRGFDSDDAESFEDDFDRFLEQYVEAHHLLDDDIFAAAEEIFVSHVHRVLIDDPYIDADAPPTTFGEVLGVLEERINFIVDADKFHVIPKKLEAAYYEREKKTSEYS